MNITMIESEQEYETAKTTISRIEQGLALPYDPDFDPRIEAKERGDAEDLLRILSLRVQGYELLREGRAEMLPLYSFEELPDAFIFARLALGLSQHEFATRLGIEDCDLRGYEESRYANVTFGCLSSFARRLGLLVSHDVIVPLPLPEGIESAISAIKLTADR
jgi:hypothetical protein